MVDPDNQPSSFTFAEDPLAIIKGNDGKDILAFPEGKEAYGFIDGEQLIMYNEPEEPGIQGMYYKLKDVLRIRTADVGMVKVETKMGVEYTHRKRSGSTEEYTILEAPEYIAADENDLWNTRRLIKRMFPNYSDCLYKDVLRDRLMIDCAMIGEPGRIVPYTGNEGVELAKIRETLETYTETRTTDQKRPKTIRFKSKKDNTDDAIRLLADGNLRNPFIDRIKRVHWDGVERVDTFLKDIGCSARVLDEIEDEAYLQIVSRGIFLSVLERNLNESYRSIKFIPLIVGEQDAGKTTLCEKLGLGKDPGWYRSTKAGFEDEKKFYESVQGSVIAELKEGTQMKKDTVESIKSFADDTVLQYRKSYGKDASSMQIRFTMLITTNEEQILKDSTGNVRFYPVYMR